MPAQTSALARRLPIALLVSALVFATVGTAFAASQSASDIPAEITLPSTHYGDTFRFNVTYDRTLRDESGHASSSQPVLEGKWIGSERIVDARGDHISADRIDLNSPSAVSAIGPTGAEVWAHQEQVSLWVAPLGSATLLESGKSNNTYTPFVSTAYPTITSSTTDHVGVERLDFLDGRSADCLAALPWAGEVLRRGHDLDSAACSVGGSLPTRFVWTGTSHVNGGVAYHYASDTVQIWLQAGIAYPVRAIVADSELGQVQFELVGLAVGGGPRQPAGEIVTGPGPQLSARQPWGMDDSGVSHPFPLSTAYRNALANYAPLQTFTAEHPDAYVVRASYMETSLQGIAHRYWFVVVTDGVDAIGLVANRTAFFAPLPLGAIDIPQRDTYSSYWVSPNETATFPLPGGLPDQLPTVGSMLQRWNDMPGQHDVPNGWGFLALRCDGCEHPVVLPMLTDLRSDEAYALPKPGEPGFPGLNLGMGLAYSQFAFMPDATAISFFGIQYDLEAGTKFDPGFSLDTPKSAPEPGTSLAAALPSLGIIEGTGLFALLAGAAYYFWPVFKAGPLSLFSRVRNGPDAHPARTLLVDLVGVEPGIHFAEVQRRSGLPNGTLVHHLRALVSQGRLRAQPLGGYTCYFPGGSAINLGAGAVKADGARRLLAAIEQSPGISGLELSAQTGLQASTVHYHVARLIEGGLVSGRRDGRSVRLHAVRQGGQANAGSVAA